MWKLLHALREELETGKLAALQVKALTEPGSYPTATGYFIGWRDQHQELDAASLSPNTEATLCAIGERGDIIKTSHRAMQRAGGERSPEL